MRQFVAGTLPYLTQAQQMLPIGAFTQPQVPQVAGLSPTQQWATAQIPGIAQAPGQQWYAPFGQSPQGGGAGGLRPQPGIQGGKGSTGQPPQGSGIGPDFAYDPIRNPTGGFGQDFLVSPQNYTGQPWVAPGQKTGPAYGNDMFAVDVTGQPVQGAGGQAPGTAQEAGLAQLAQLTSGQIGQSPLTQAGMNAFETIQRPQIENTLATMGLGRSGAGANILEQSRAQVLAPLIQQEIGYRGAAVPQLFGLGPQLSGQQATAAGMGLQAGGTEQQTAQAALDAAQKDYARRQQLSQNLFFGVPQSTESATSTTAPRQNFFGK